MTPRLATTADIADLDAFLMDHAEGSMFPLGNLRMHGLGLTDNPRSTEYWVASDGASITGAVGVSREGFVFPQMPDPDPALAKFVRGSIAGRALEGILGPLQQAHAMRAALGLDAAPVRHLGDEPHYALDLERLDVPSSAGLTLLRPDETHRATLIEWRSHYVQEVMRFDPADAGAKAEADVEGFLSGDNHRLLMRGDRPVSLTGFNAALPEIVQIGAVYTPPPLRRQGLARGAVALHLAEARTDGARRAVLFAANPHAARAYEAIGFRRIGDYSMIFFDGPQEVPPCPD